MKSKFEQLEIYKFVHFNLCNNPNYSSKKIQKCHKCQPKIHHNTSFPFYLLVKISCKFLDSI